MTRTDWINRWVEHMASIAVEENDEFLIGLPDSNDHFWDQQIEAHPTSPEQSAEDMLNDRFNQKGCLRP